MKELSKQMAQLSLILQTTFQKVTCDGIKFHQPLALLDLQIRDLLIQVANRIFCVTCAGIPGPGSLITYLDIPELGSLDILCHVYRNPEPGSLITCSGFPELGSPDTLYDGIPGPGSFDILCHLPGYF
jgi:hypothetical protein